MKIEVLSLSKKLNKNDKAENYSKVISALNQEDTTVSKVLDFIPAVEYSMRKSAEKHPDFIIIENALGTDSEKAFKSKFAGIIHRGEKKVQEKPYIKPKTSLAEKCKKAISSVKSIPGKLKSLTKKNRQKPEIPTIDYDYKKTQIFNIDTDDQKSYAFSYLGTRVIVLCSDIEGDTILSVIEKVQERFNSSQKDFPQGYRLIPKQYKVYTFAQRNFPQGFDSLYEKVRKSVRLVAFCTLIVTGILLIYNMYVLPMQNSAIQSEIQTIFHNTENGGTTTGKIKNHNWAKLKKINSDIQGWIQIKDTKIDYPILQCKSDSIEGQYYLTHNYKKEPSGYGGIFIDYRSTKGMNSKNVVIHGHHMIDGSMFANLLKYGDRSGGKLDFYKKVPTVQISTPKGGTEDYKIISVFKSNVNPAQGEYFDFYCGSFKSDAQFMNYVYNLRIRSLINCPVSVNEDDQLITLTTCSYEFEDFRTVVVARKCRKGESSDVDVSSASLNHNAVWPQCYYSRNGGTRPQISTFQTALKEKKIDWYDGDNKLSGSEELPTTVTETTEPTTKPTETEKPKYYSVKIYNKGKLIKNYRVQEGGRVPLPNIAKTYKKGNYKYTFQKWQCSSGSYNDVRNSMKIVAKYKKEKIKNTKPKPTKPAVKPTVKPTQKPTQKPTVKPTQKPTEKPTTQPTEVTETSTDDNSVYSVGIIEPKE